MNTLAPVAPRASSSLLLHRGAERIERGQLIDIPTPTSTDSWFPIAHEAVVSEVQSHLEASGFLIEEEAHSTAKDGLRYFGVIQVRLPESSSRDYSWVVGLRNSHDKSYPAGLVAGTRVFVCDNLAFSGVVKLSRKHTKNGMRDLRKLASNAVGKLASEFKEIDTVIEATRSVELSDRDAHDLVIRAADVQAISHQQIRPVIEEWRRPSFEEFEPRNAWSLFNAVTEVYKRGSAASAVARSQNLHQLFKGVALAS